jgi:hypothetical protein
MAVTVTSVPLAWESDLIFTVLHEILDLLSNHYKYRGLQTKVRKYFVVFYKLVWACAYTTRGK